jgi:hypothetical protein
MLGDDIFYEKYSSSSFDMKEIESTGVRLADTLKKERKNRFCEMME